MNKTCECPAFRDNMPLIDGAIMRTGGYSGEFIKFCPWCGERLEVPFQETDPGQMRVVLNRKHFGNELGISE